MTLTADQLTQRRQGIGASEVGAIFGLDPYKTALDVYLDKIGELPPREFAPELSLGHKLEPVVAELYQEAHPNVSLRLCDTVTHPVVGYFLATPDREVVPMTEDGAAEYLLEIKTRRWRTAQAFGVEGTDMVPPEVALQCHWQMLVTGRSRVDVALLVDGRDYREYRIHEDAALADLLYERMQDFWTQHVIPRIPPALDGSESAGKWLARRLPQTTDVILDADESTTQLMRDLRTAREAVAAAAARQAYLENALKLQIGEAAGLQGPAGRITWKASKPSRSVDWKGIVEEVGAPADVVAKHTTEKPGSRRFLPTFTDTEA